MLLTTLCVMLFGLLGAIHVSILPETLPAFNTHRELSSMMSLDEEMKTLGRLKYIADKYQTVDIPSGSRYITTGYNDSMGLITTQLQGFGLKPWSQPFSALSWERGSQTYLNQIAGDPQSFILGTDFDVMRFSGGGSVTGGITTPPSESQGCKAADWSNHGQHAGKIAIVSRGTCPFAEKAKVAAQVGVVALLIYDPTTTGLFGGTLGAESSTIPVFSIQPSLARSFLDNLPNTNLELFSNAHAFDVFSRNIIVDLPGGNPVHQIVVGAHLDSVEAGPGINDNGSGSAMLLEFARVFVEKYGLNGLGIHNQVRLMWFGEEEQGLIGSKYYVQHMNPFEFRNTIAYLNFDMIGSPNYINGIYDGSSDANHPVESSYLAQLFRTYFDNIQMPYVLATMSGGSDHYYFREVGVPSSGLITGAGSKKSIENAAIFGGTAGEPCDPCYHQKCDDLLNINTFIYNKTSRAAAYAVESLAIQPNLRETMATPRSTNFKQQKAASWYVEECDAEPM